MRNKTTIGKKGESDEEKLAVSSIELLLDVGSGRESSETYQAQDLGITYEQSPDEAASKS